MRTSLTAVLTALLTRSTKRNSSGVTATAINVKSQRHNNITTIMPTTVRVLVTMLRVAVEAKLWIVWTSLVRVDRMVPTRVVS